MWGAKRSTSEVKEADCPLLPALHSSAGRPLLSLKPCDIATSSSAFGETKSSLSRTAVARAAFAVETGSYQKQASCDWQTSWKQISRSSQSCSCRSDEAHAPLSFVVK